MGSFVRVALTSEVLKKPGQVRCVQSASKPIPSSCATANHPSWYKTRLLDGGGSGRRVGPHRSRLPSPGVSASQTVGDNFFLRSNVVRKDGSHGEVFRTCNRGRIQLRPSDHYCSQHPAGPMSAKIYPWNKSFECLHHQ